MKKIINILTLLICTLSIYSQSGWFTQNSNSSNFLRSIYAVDDNNCWVLNMGSYGDTIQILRTTNGGQNWNNLVNLNLNISPQVLYFTNTITGFMAGLAPVGGKGVIFATSNSGINWSLKYESPQNYIFFRDLFFVNSSTGWCVGGALIDDGIVLNTTNGGVNWTVQINGLLFALQSVHFFNNTSGWTVGSNGICYKTTNAGANWIQNHTGFGMGNHFAKVQFANANTGWILENDQGKVLITTNGGSNWLSSQFNTDERYIDLHFVNANTGWIVGTSYQNFNGIIKKTTNTGTNWHIQYSGVPNSPSPNDVHFINATTGWTAGSDGIILKTTNGGAPIGIHIISSEIPSQFEIHQNYPNPFNPVTNIEFDISKTSVVKLIVYDILGKEVAVLVNEELKAGEFSVDWNAITYPSGIYLYKITAGEYSETRKMVLIK